ncbi:MAG TPA: S9 family peptidase [Mycobacteriales bacterium]|nr:S9 family peptidase [Mycobacteriales bacterium]
MTGPRPPIAKIVPTERTHHGDTVIDPYAWLRVKEDPDTIAYLTAENEYTEAATADQAGLRDQVYGEITARTQQTDLSVPARHGGFWYYRRTVEGRQYGIQCRRPVAAGEVDPPSTGDGAPLDGEQILLDGNVLAGDSEFLSLGTFDVSPDGRLLAYSTDFAGAERFTLRIKNLDTGEVLPDEVPGTFYGSAWSADGSVLFYLTVDEAWRPHRVWRHVVGTPASADEVVFEEPDERFWVGVELTRSERFVLIDARSKITTEVRYIPADQPLTGPALIATRRDGVEYSVEHQADRFLILHNDGAEDFALASTPDSAPGEWAPVLPHQPGVRLMRVTALAGHLVVSLRRDGLTGLRVLPQDGRAPYDLSFPEPIYTVSADANPAYDTARFRLRYTSLVTPDSVYDCDLDTGELLLRKQTPVLGGYDPGEFEQHREFATAADGTRVPISLVCRRGTARDGSARCLLYGYGSYESSQDPRFSIPRLSLLDRDIVYAIAHIRGGGELGRHWYLDGKLLSKMNTFTDFVACADHLAKSGWTSPERLVARGGSAGGLLMGATANLAPDAFAGIVAQVPFVDALNSILDPSLPLTVTEWEEWGDPLHDPEVYAYMKSYTPYENVAARRYPAILAMCGLNDTRVLYHEAAKWVARLRATTPETPVLLKTEMASGHGGPSGIYDAWRNESFVLAWIVTHLTR